MPRTAGLAAAALVATGLVVAGPSSTALAGTDPDLGADPTVTADALPTVQIDGVVWSQVVVGNTVYVAGDFTTARPAGAAPGTQTVPRSNLLAYDIATGQLVESWAPSTNGVVHAIAASPDGSQIFVGGAFNRVNNVGRSRFAALSASTGAVLSSFSAGTNGEVRGIAVAPDAVYITGTFNTVGGQSRARVASFTPSGTLRGWSANVQSRISYDIATSPDGSRVFIGGAFEKVNNVPRLGTAALSGATGALLPWDVSDEVYSWGPDAAVTSVNADESNVYFTSMAFLDDATGWTNTEGAFAADQATGEVVWLADCHGDTYDVFANSGQDHVYLAGHPHMCNNIGSYPEERSRVHRYATALTKQAFGLVSTNTQLARFYVNVEGFPAPKVRTFFPTFTEGQHTGQHQATWQVTGNSDYVVYGGEFLSVNGVAQQGLVRFAKPHLAPGLQGPRVSGSATTPTLQSHARGTMQVSWQTNHDIDDGALTYRVLRNGTVVHEVTAPSTFWNRPRLSFTDTGLADNTNYTYRIEVSDSAGNTVLSPQVTARTLTSSAAPLSEYAATILEDAPNNYWRLGEPSGSFQDWTSFSDATAGSGVTRNQAGAIADDSDRAARFTGSSSSRAYSSSSEGGLDHLSIEAWFRTSSTSGGKVVGFGSTRGTGSSSNYDRHIYMTPSGQLVFGVHPGAPRTITSPGSYNDDAWHHVVATLGLRGIELYVDGVLVAHDPGVVSGQASFRGYWRIGGDNLGGWPEAGSAGFTGLIDEVATYGRQLGPNDVVRHYTVGSGNEVPNLAPDALFTATGGELTATVDASASSDPDGTIESYGWDWGDGTSSVTATPTTSHDYDEPGTYTVTLTVTDDRGGVATAIREVVVTAPNQGPLASFEVDVVGRLVSVDASASSDPDGSIVGYSWSWGDGTPAGSGTTATHLFGADGTYQVTLTVTDDDGASATTSRVVEVEAPLPGGAIASDAFGRSVASGWGAADLGGSWVTAGSASVSEGAGQLVLGSSGAIAGGRLPGASGVDLVTSVSTVWDKRPSGSGGATLLRGRIGDSGEYRFKLEFKPDGRLVGWVVRTNASGAETRISDVVTLPFTYGPGTVVRQTMEVVGTSPTTVRVKVWTGAQEPDAWGWQVTDGTSALQGPGHTGIAALLGSGVGNTPVRVTIDDYLVRMPT